MSDIRTWAAALCLALAATAYSASYVRKGSYVTINTDGGAARTVRLQVISDNIIRVEQTPEAVMPSKRQSLVVVPQKPYTNFSVSEDKRYVYVRAPRIRCQTEKATGRVRLTDADGRLLLHEHSKSFKPFVSTQTELPQGYRPSAPEEVNWGKKTNLNILSEEDRSGYTWSVAFDTPDDESIYGLGQHQSEEMDYKGRNEELFQYNTKVSIPFVMSTAGYGLLWDSYSLGRWGSPNDYQQLGRVLALYDKSRAEGALTGTYTDRRGNQTVRREDSLYFENSQEITKLPKGFALNGSHVVYEGYLKAPLSDSYKFILYYAGYVKVYIDGHLVVPERWRTAWNPNAYKFDVALLKGRMTPIRIEWQPDGDVSYCGLRVAVPQAEEQQRRVALWAEMDKDMDYYVIAAERMDDIIKGYRQLTGRAQVMPKWSLGFWQSRERYKTQAEVEATLAEFRRRQVPVDVMVQDWNYWEEDQWGSHRFDPARYPDPQRMYDTIHQQGARLMISCWPKFYCNTDNYKSLDKNGWIYQQAVKDSIRDWVGPGYIGSFYDAYSAGARRMFWQQMDENLYSKYGKGMDAWWMDASEPNVRDCTPIAYRKQLCGPTALGTSDEYFNAYSIVNADAIYNGQRAVDKDKRVFLLTRSGFAGEQRYSTATWSGDIGTRWEDMRAQMTAGLNFSMAGVPFWGMDIGGFCVENRYVQAQKAWEKTGTENDDMREWRELQARWHQFGCFVPLFRTHGQWPRREVWNIAPEGHPAYESIVYYDKLRYRLMPYLYSMAGWVHFNDYTMLRGLAMDYKDDERVRGIKNQWMFGPSLMACPVGEYKARSREVYFPKTRGWYDLYTKRYYQGGRTMAVDAPYGRIPVFVPEGAIIPFGPELQYSDEKQPELITLYVYAGADGSFTLYEDEGTNYNYEKGRYSTIEFSYDNAARTLTISGRKGAFKGMLKARRFNIVLVDNASKPTKDLDLSASGGTMVHYDGKAVTVKLDDPSGKEDKKQNK